MPLTSEVPLDEVPYFDFITSRFDTGAATDADSTPTFEVFEESTDTDIGVGGNATKRTSKTGNYRVTFTASAANGFEVGKWYSVVASATVNSVAGKGVIGTFRVRAAEHTAGYPVSTIKDGTGTGEIDTTSGGVLVATIAANAITATAIASDAITAAKIAAGAIDAATFAADVDAEILSYLVDDATRIDASALNTAAVTTVPAINTNIGTPSNLGSGATVAANLVDIESQTDDIGAAGAGLTEAGGTGDQFTAVPWNPAWDAEVQSEVQDALDAPVADSIPADGSRPSIAQAAYLLSQFMMERAVSGTTLTIHKPDGTTALMTLTLDDGTNPTAITRST